MLFFNKAPRKHKLLASIYLKQICASNLPADGQQLFTPPNHKEIKITNFLCAYIVAVQQFELKLSLHYFCAITD